MVIWFLIYTTVAISNLGIATADTHYRKYATEAQCAAAREAFNGTDNMFAECFSKKIEVPTALPKTSL